jgi:hypothetical protein
LLGGLAVLDRELHVDGVGVVALQALVELAQHVEDALALVGVKARAQAQAVDRGGVLGASTHRGGVGAE